MDFEIIESKKLHVKVIYQKHPTGLDIYVAPKSGYSSQYAIFGTKYGSIDNLFKEGEKSTAVPEGIAHFLEHKLFESEDGDTFSRFAKTGASANAYTSFDRTCYLFSCTSEFRASLEILLDFVQKPYFTKKTVQKEQGIIGQEIKMYDDDPNWQVFFGLLRSLYHAHPVKTDIAGTAQSIAQITPELLYKCYQSFYNLNNMVLCVAGDVDPSLVLEVADTLLKPAPALAVQSIFERASLHQGLKKGSR
jgi:predicted Zn-dependent peptidase